MKAYTGTKGIAPLIFSLGPRRILVVNVSSSGFKPIKERQYLLHREMFKS